MLKIVVISALGVASLWLCRGYSAFLDKRLGETRGLLNLVTHIRDSLTRSLGFGGELYRDFSDDYLEGCGLLPLLRSGTPPLEALGSPEVSLNISEGTRKRATELFSAFGRGYLDGEINRLTSFIDEASAELREMTGELEKNKKVASALIFGIWSSIAIILI